MSDKCKKKVGEIIDSYKSEQTKYIKKEKLGFKTYEVLPSLEEWD
jgi:hypothetical protein